MMATFVGLSTQTFLGHLDLTDHTDKVTFGALKCAMQTSTTYADGGYTCAEPGLISGDATVSGFQDFAADVLDDEISIAQLGTAYPLTVIPNPTGTVTVGDVLDSSWPRRHVLAFGGGRSARCPASSTT